MTSLLRQLVAGPRARHPEAKLDLCYVTPTLIVTSGPALTYPSRAYRNPLDQLVKFLKSQHVTNWRIFEFRAEGTGYKDDEVEGRIEHFPWPDHHPPPFGVLVDTVLAMHKWLGTDGNKDEGTKDRRVAVLHCKAGKGRSGTVTCSYLIAIQGWTEEQALQRFTERRMRPGWGDGVSIRSQRRWITYVGRWAKDGRRYKDGKVKIVEIRLWGMRDSVAVAIRGFIEGGKRIEHLHQWSDKDAGTVKLEGEDGTIKSPTTDEVPNVNGEDTPQSMKKAATTANGSSKGNTAAAQVPNGNAVQSPEALKSPTGSVQSASYFSNPAPPTFSILRPKKPIILPSFDINIEVEKRNKNFTSMVTSTAHSWFNVYFEGNGPEKHGDADKTGIYSIEWDDMDGLKGSSRRGVRAIEKVAVVWEIVDDEEAAAVEEELEAEEPAIESAGESHNETVGEEKRTGSDVASDSDAEEGVQSYGVKGEKV